MWQFSGTFGAARQRSQGQATRQARTNVDCVKPAARNVL